MSGARSSASCARLEASPNHPTSRSFARKPINVSSILLKSVVARVVTKKGTLAKTEYDDRTLVRMLGMRRTLFVEPLELVPVVQSAASRAIARRERDRLLGFLAAGGIVHGGAEQFREGNEGHGPRSPNTGISRLTKDTGFAACYARFDAHSPLASRAGEHGGTGGL